MNRKRYLVTGGTGFLGSALVRHLVANGHEVRVLDNNSRGRPERLGAAASEVELFDADLRDAAAVARACSGVDSVCHLGFINGTEFFYSMPELVLEVAVLGMMNVLRACLEHDIPELVLASSSEVYQTAPTVPTDETVPLSVPDPLNPRYSYGGGKIISELLAINYGRKYFHRVLVFRPHNVYGPDMGWEHVVPQFVLRMRRLAATSEGPIGFPIQGTGSETRAFIHIDDFTAGLAVLLERGEHLNIYHVGTTEERSIAELAREVGRYFGRVVQITPGPAQPGGTLRRCPDISKLHALGWSPHIAFSEGIQQTARWYDANAHRAPQLQPCA